MDIINIRSDKSTVLWGYAATLLSVASGLIVLPLILRYLSSEEVAVYYLLITISSFAALFDLGFSPQISKNLTYIFSGADNIKKEGYSSSTGVINYKLLKSLIEESKNIYRKISLAVFIVLAIFGTIYIIKVTKDTLPLEYILPLWLLFVLITSAQMYFFYYNAFMEGKGLIKRAKQINVISRIFNIVIVSAFLLLGLKLWAVLIGYVFLLVVFVVFSKKAFYTKDITEEMLKIEVDKSDLKDVFDKIWFNAKKVAIIYFFGFLINKSNLFIAGLYLDLKTVASLGLMMQFTALIASLSENFYLVMQPEIISLRVKKEQEQLIKKFSCGIVVYILLFVLGSVILLTFVPFLLKLIGSNTELPTLTIMAIYCLICLLERQHSTFAAFISTGNRIFWLESTIIVGALIVAGSFLVLKYTSMGLLGLILVQGVIQLCYSNWKWPYEALKELKMNYFVFLYTGARELIGMTRSLLYIAHLDTK